MKKILLSKQGKIQKYAFVDDQDYEWLKKFRWSAHKTRAGLWCAERGKRWGKRRFMIKMHRLIMKARPYQEIDHINRNGLDNRRENLRICTRSENLINRGIFKNKKVSIYFGVIRIIRGKYKRYYGRVQRNKKIYETKFFRTQREAYLARQELVRELCTSKLFY